MRSNCLGIPEELHSLHRSQNTSGKAVALLLEATRPTTKLKMAQARDYGRSNWPSGLDEKLGWDFGGEFRVFKTDVDTGEFRKLCTGPGQMHLRKVSRPSAFSSGCSFLGSEWAQLSGEGGPQHRAHLYSSFAPFFGCSCFSLFICAPGTQGNLWTIHWTWAKGSEISVITHNKQQPLQKQQKHEK